jgi:hypothetical protein
MPPMKTTPELPDGFSIGPLRAAEVSLLDDMAAAGGQRLWRHVVRVRLKAIGLSCTTTGWPSPSSLE